MSPSPDTKGRRRRTVPAGLARLGDEHAAAWIGLLETHKRLTRALDAELEAAHGLRISGLEVLSRLAGAQDGTMRLSALADAAGLSLSRVSRIVDALERRALVERRADPVDTRARNASLTAAGLEVLRAALRTHFDGVERLFFDRVPEADVATLARVFAVFRR